MAKPLPPMQQECWREEGRSEAISQTYRQSGNNFEQQGISKDGRTFIMLIEAKKLHGYKLESLDGEIGRFKEFYFDDRHWAIRYLIAETGGWLTGRQVLISPQTLGAVIRERQHISVDLTRK
jgi:hypothetical protein